MVSGFYIVRRGSATHKAIEEMHAKRRKAIDERWKFVRREFPDSRKRSSKYEIVSWTGFFGDDLDWGVKLPRDNIGRVTFMNEGWRFARKSSDCIKPKVSTAAGKALKAEMDKGKYKVPGAAQFGRAIGIQPYLSPGLVIRTPAFTSTTDGRYVVTLYGDMEPNKDMKRITDVQFEKLTNVSTKDDD